MPLRNVIVLALSQALGSAGIPAVVLLSGIIGVSLAPSPSLATLPVAIGVIGVAVSTIPAAMLMKRIGRRRGFMTAFLMAAAGALLAAYAVASQNFALFCVGTLLIGANNAFAQQFRFAAGESVGPRFTGRAVSIVLLGGIVAGYLGPEVAKRTKDLLAVEYSGSFLSLAALFLLGIIIVSFMRDVVPAETEVAGHERSLRELLALPAIRVAILAAAVSYGVMSLIMTATPVYLHSAHGFDLEATTLIIQSHVIAMYVPSLFTGFVLERFGISRVMGAGVAILLVCVGLALVSSEFIHYWGALVLLGLGWNLMFVSATVLLARSYRPVERFKVQATNEFAVFSVQALASLSAGTLLFYASWTVLNLISLPLLLAVLVALILMRQQVGPKAQRARAAGDS